VSQTQSLTNQMVHLTFTNFTPSVIPGNKHVFAAGQTNYAVGIYECNGNEPTENGTGQGAEDGSCYTPAPDTVGQPDGPGNSVKTFVTADTGDDGGTGSAEFQIETSEQNNFLDCNATSSCSLVVVPNWGGVQTGPVPDPKANCASHTADVSPFLPSAGNAVDNKILQACSWADRIVVPLSFAPTPAENCPATGAQFNAEGAPSLERAMTQWLPAWCKPTNGQQPLFVGYDPTVNEESARTNFLSGGQAFSAGTDVALVGEPASADQTSASSRKFTYAPVSVSGISIVYYVDDQTTGQPITNLVLDARLVAKLLTQSYTFGFNDCQQGQTVQSATCDPGDAGNPVDIFHDPEFQQLNPEYTLADFSSARTPQSASPGPGQSVDLGFLPTVLAGNSDLTFELTRWIESDPEARAFLAGQPDEWGMHVNSFYKGIAYPLFEFEALDPGWDNLPNAGETMQLTWNPVSGLDNIVQILASNTSSAELNQPSCSLVPLPPQGGCAGGIWNYPRKPAEPLGTRALFAIVDQGSAAADQFPSVKLVNPAGDAVGPTTASMSAAVTDMRTNPDKITQFADFDSNDPKQYPLTTVNYAMVPTCDVSQATTTAISHFLTNVATSAQLIGTDLGQLPPFGGYLPLTGAQKAQTTQAANDVSTQSCTSPPPDTTIAGLHISTAHLPSPFGPNSGVSGSTAPGSTSANPAGSSPGKTTGAPTHAGGPGRGRSTPLGLKSLDTSGFMKLVLPVALGVGGLLALIAGLTYALNATEPGRRLLNRIRRRLGIQPPLTEAGDAE
jgi:hypothetical protein